MEDHIVLYRQYRPLKFDDVVGQEAAVTALRQSVVAKKLAHAYLFCGQHGTGKTTIAKIFARAVNCENPINGNPCNECPTCKGILDGSILDVTEMDAASNNGVDDIRPILQEVNFAPTRTTYKVYIIDEVHMLSKGAFNALLKTIEEPPKHVMFLFATTESDKIPATIISRCQRYDFKRIPIDLISGRLREVCGKSGINASDDALRLIASRSDGALRDALSLLDQISAISGDKEITSQDVERITGTVDSSFLFKMANCLIDARFDELIDLCEILNGSGKNQARFTLDLAAYFRDLLIIRVKADPIIYLPYPKETIQDMYQTAAKVSADTLTGYISYLSKEYAELRKSPDIATSFELMLMRLCGRKSALPVTPIVIPDFEKNQAAKAATLTLNDSPAKSSEAVKITEEVKKPEEEKSSDEPKASSEESKISEEPKHTAETKPSKDVKSLFKKKTEEPAKAEESAEEKSSVSEPAPDAEPSIPVPPAPYRPQPSATPYRPQPSATPSIFGTSSSEPKESEEPKPSTGSLFSSIIQEPEIPAPAEPEEPAEPAEDDSQDDEYIPADTSHEKHAEPTIFSFMPKEDENTESKFSFGFDEPEEQEEPAPMQPLGIFGNLSPSFLNDLENEEEEETVEPEVPVAPVQPRSQIAVQADKSGLIVDGRSSSVRAPSFTGEDADIAVRWTNVTSRLKGTNENIAVILERTSLKKEGTSAYIVFEDRDITLLSNLKKSQAFRQISSGIKDEFGADHLYICTQKQYSEQVKREQASELDRKLDDFNERSKNMGVPTDVHFGD